MAYSIPYEVLEEATTVGEYLKNKEDLRRRKEEEEIDREIQYSDTKACDSPRSHNRARHTSPTTRNNPKYEKGMKLSNTRDYYSYTMPHSSVMPKTISKAEKEYKAAAQKERDIAINAKNLVDKHIENRGKYTRNYDKKAAYDATRRHIRRHTNESACIFESIEFI